MTALILMGISIGTYTGAAVFDTIEIDQGALRSQDQPTSGWFFRDILSDKNGISLHRFQNVIWTIIAIVVYIYRYNNLNSGQSLPDLDSTLLTLTGISSATYLTLKTRENTTAGIEAQIHIITDPSVSAVDRKAFLDKSGNSVLTVTITDNKSDIITPLPSSNGLNGYDLTVSNLNPGQYSVKVSVMLIDPNSPSGNKTLVGQFDGQIIKNIAISISVK